MSGTLTLGTKGDTDETGSLKVSKESPKIISGGYGISNSGTFNFYDGIIKSKTAINGTVKEVEEGYEIITSSDDTYKDIKYLDLLPVAKIKSTDVEYYSIQEAIDASNEGDTIVILRNATYSGDAETNIISQDKNIMIDINGMIVKGNSNALIENNGTLKIIDSTTKESDEGELT